MCSQEMAVLRHANKAHSCMTRIREKASWKHTTVEEHSHTAMRGWNNGARHGYGTGITYMDSTPLHLTEDCLVRL